MSNNVVSVHNYFAIAAAKMGVEIRRREDVPRDQLEGIGKNFFVNPDQPPDQYIVAVNGETSHTTSEIVLSIKETLDSMGPKSYFEMHTPFQRLFISRSEDVECYQLVIYGKCIAGGN